MAKITVNSDEAMTEMPDGRPLFAWQNEIEIASARYEEAQALMREAKTLMKLLRIAEVEQKKDLESGDIIIRFRMSSLVRDPHSEPELEKHYVRET